MPPYPDWLRVPVRFALRMLKAKLRRRANTPGLDPAVLNAIESRLRGYGLGKVSQECHSLCWNMLQPHDEGFPRIGMSDSLPACVCSMPCWLHCVAVWTSFRTSVVD